MIKIRLLKHFVSSIVVLFCDRVNDLDKELKVLTATHNTLQIEATKKGAALEKTSFYVTSLQQDIDELQKVHMLLVSVWLFNFTFGLAWNLEIVISQVLSPKFFYR